MQSTLKWAYLSLKSFDLWIQDQKQFELPLKTSMVLQRKDGWNQDWRIFVLISCLTNQHFACSLEEWILQSVWFTYLVSLEAYQEGHPRLSSPDGLAISKKIARKYPPLTETVYQFKKNEDSNDHYYCCDNFLQIIVSWTVLFSKFNFLWSLLQV